MDDGLNPADRDPPHDPAFNERGVCCFRPWQSEKGAQDHDSRLEPQALMMVRIASAVPFPDQRVDTYRPPVLAA